MKTLAVLAVAAILAQPAFAADPAEGEVDATFTWTAIDLATQPAPYGGAASLIEAHLVVTSNAGGPIDGLAGTCLLRGQSRGQDWQASGTCALKDADGDFLFEAVEEVGDKGHSVLTGGTGKFAGITGEHDYTTTWFSSVRDGESQGIGVKKGHWKLPAM